MGHFSTVIPPPGAVDLHTHNKAGVAGTSEGVTIYRTGYYTNTDVLTVSITLTKPCVVVAVAHIVQGASSQNWRIYQDTVDITVEVVQISNYGYHYDFEVIGKTKLAPGTYTFKLRDPTYTQYIYSASLHVIAVE
jgi:hypothetical protein